MSETPRPVEEAEKIRLDKWLWHARFFKSRALSAGRVKGGHVRVNGNRAAKPSQMVRVGDVLTFVQGRAVRVVRIVASGARRGPAPEAQTLYEDLSPVPDPESETFVTQNPRYEGKGRPTKRDRRKLDLDPPGALE